MGTEALLIAGLAASAIGTGVAVNENRKTANRQDSAAAEGIRQQAANQAKVNQRLNRTLDQTGASTADDSRQRAQGSYLDQIQRSMAQAKQGLAMRNLSDQYDALASQEAANASDYAGTVANLMARIDAGGLQRQAEQNAFANTGMDLDVIGQMIQGDQHLNNMRIKRIRNNPYADFAAGALRGAGQGMAGAYGG